MTHVARRRAALPFVLVVVFIDVLGIGIALPVLVGEYTTGRELQTYWYGSDAVDADRQAVTMGALASINSLMFVVAPAIGAPLLGFVSHLPSSDWRVGATFFVSAALQLVAFFLARRHFAPAHIARTA